MRTIIRNKDRIAKHGAIAGITSSIFYFGAALLNFLPNKFQMLLGFFFPILMIVGFVGVYHYLKEKNISLTLEVAYLFGLFAGLIACTFIVIQQANMLWHQEISSIGGNESIHASQSVFKSVNRVQLAMDVVFDIFISISMFLLGISVIKTKKVNPLFGWVGCFLASLLLILNMFTFPNPPSSNNIFDVGPLIGVWMLTLFILIYTKTRSKTLK